jgi:hypothetical protein
MKIEQQIAKIFGEVTATIRDAETGKIKRVLKYYNTVVTVGRAVLANQITASAPSPADPRINKVALGSNVAAPDAADVKLGTEVYRNSVASATNASNIAYVTGFFNATETTGTYKEAGLFINGGAGADSGTLFSHVAINITKAATETLTLDWTITIS